MNPMLKTEVKWYSDLFKVKQIVDGKYKNILFLVMPCDRRKKKKERKKKGRGRNLKAD